MFDIFLKREYKQKGFTLIELLIVIGIIAILAAAVIIAINPGRQFAVARDSTRERHINSLVNAILSYQIDNQGSFGEIIVPETFTEICNTDKVSNPETDCVGFVNVSALIPEYLAYLPVDPQVEGNHNGTGYEIALRKSNIAISAPKSETKIVSLNLVAGGGHYSETLIGGVLYGIHVFNEAGEHTFNAPKIFELDVLVVAGGGGGGGAGGGGGGAGGLLYYPEYNVVPGETINITVGDGGAGGPGSPGTNPKYGTEGENSLFGVIEVTGGGTSGGAQSDPSSPRDGTDGGSGGGGGGREDISQAQGGSGILGQGNNGGMGPTGSVSSRDSGGGGGGAGNSGSDAVNQSSGGDGGDGLYFGHIFGEQYGESGWFAGGGGGGGASNGDGIPGNGGSGGGGEGVANENQGTGKDGLVNTGGGGGGGAYNGSSWTGTAGGSGGSGVVLLRYRI